MQRNLKLYNMKYQTDSNGKRMSKYDMAHAMKFTNHSNTPKDYWYYNTIYFCLSSFTYEEIQNEYRKCFNLN